MQYENDFIRVEDSSYDLQHRRYGGEQKRCLMNISDPLLHNKMAHIVVDFLDDILSTVSGKPRPMSSQLPMNKIPEIISANISSNWGINFFRSRLK